MRPQKVRNSCIPSGKKGMRAREGLNYDSPGGASRVYSEIFYPRDYLSISFSARLSSGMHVPVQKSINLRSKLFIGISFNPLFSRLVQTVLLRRARYCTQARTPLWE
jgi:hypothetical protein